VKAARTFARVQVSDQGPGVPEKDLKLIFEPFYRVDAARPRRDRAGGGDGLGLAIAARAVALHGGTIEAGNVPAADIPSGGLIVTITLPALEAGAREAPDAAAAEPVGT
jgi:signal transduction histidine kinase